MASLSVLPFRANHAQLLLPAGRESSEILRPVKSVNAVIAARSDD